ncbi:MAG TPA: acyl-CoA dehydrogenase family protein [Candidatus Dormibacteraeota bacterium]|nr:acyl-CoA dehydrogenase family protein [Candidatus Dormibacteraeota bacterium]
MATTTDALTHALIPSEEELSIREAVAAICSQFGRDYMRRKVEAGEPATELWDALAAQGFLSVNIPEEYGGGGLGMLELAAVGEEITASGCSLLLIVVSPAIVGTILAKHGTEPQKQRWLTGIGSGRTKIAFAITEPDAGTNSHNLATSLTPTGDGYRLNGQKVFISGIESADAILVVARLRSEDGSLGLPAPVIVDVDAPGLQRTMLPMAIRGADRQWQLFFDNVEIPRDRLVGGEERGLRMLFDGLNPERVMGAAISNGIGRLALDKAAEYARSRTVWQAPIATHQGIAHPLAEAKIELELARLMTRKAAALYDAGQKGAGEAANMAKYAAAEAAIKCVDRAIQTHGGNGFSLDYGLTDLYWGARVARTAPVSREMVLNYVAEHSLGLPKSY